MSFLKKLFGTNKSQNSEDGLYKERIRSTRIYFSGSPDKPGITNILIPTSDLGDDAKDRAMVAIGIFGRRHPDKKMGVELSLTKDGIVFSVDLPTQNYKEQDELGQELIGILRDNGFRIDSFLK